MTPGVRPRVRAARAVGRVLRAGAYSNVVVGVETRRLEDGERRLAAHLAYGTLRWVLRVDRAVAAHSRRPLEEIEGSVLDALRIGAFELVVDGAPAHAAVAVAVDAVRELGRRRAAGFVNAVLRSLAREGEPAPPEGLAGKALAVGQPEWLYSTISRDRGTEWADAFFVASQGEPPLQIRLRPHQAKPAGAREVDGIEGAFSLAGAAPLADLSPQDPASVAVGLAVAPRSGERVFDMAAAPGGKTLHLWDQMQGVGTLVAGDRHGRRARTARARMLGEAGPLEWVVADGMAPPFRPGTFDRVLIDAPCTGLGVLRRRPEIRYRMGPADVERLSVLQSRMVEQGIELVRDGGRVVYSVCTVTQAETEGVVGPLGGRPPDGLPGERLGSGLLMAPHTSATDGMFISVLGR